jgi:uncharacterized protein
MMARCARDITTSVINRCALRQQHSSVSGREREELTITMDQQTAGVLGIVPDHVFDQLAAGFGDAAAVAVLAEAELAINRVLVGEVAGQHPAGPAGELLSHLERSAPAVFDEVITHPFVRPWAVGCLTTGGTGASRLAAVVAAVAVRSGTDVEIDVHAPGGRLHLPTAGTFALPVEDVTVVTGPDGVTVRWPGGSAGTTSLRWRPVRDVRAGGLRVLLEDDDPYRDCHDFAVTGRLSDVEADGWAATLGRVWPGLQADAPEQIEGLARGLRAITPLRPSAHGEQLSATARHAFGAVGVAYTADPEAVAVMLVHEFQHSKLGAVLDLHDLVPAGMADLVPVGWRPAPYPVEAALQGTYAHLGVADVWRRRAERRPDDAQAAATYRTYRGWTASALAELRTGARLTGTGAAFAERMAATLDGWPA